jgi:hypothetical protein
MTIRGIYCSTMIAADDRRSVFAYLINRCDERAAFSSDGVGRRTVPAANARIVNVPSYYDSEGVVALRLVTNACFGYCVQAWCPGALLDRAL